ncbi:ligase-associated DNA damage response endonuclease PdeM [Algoriphagus resistens]|uniref:ligase-associated DNA damage response endonuclease PdeM n=1 Tax=Algoriphagus resistens TaxID=1750590 RepID=UPI000716A93F|nr:ligase-associated DNA damage response endonuclease PdeM [Algoriphagus resistens]
MDFYYKEELIQLLPQKAAFLPENRLLVVADIHLGKASHFRKAGIMIPSPILSADLQRMDELITALNPATVVFLGDLFHSSFNNEWLELKEFLLRYPAVHFILTKGNHDILPASVMEDTSIRVVDEYEVGEHLLFTHEPQERGRNGRLIISGHIHPGVLIKSKGRQSYRLPCFYYHNGNLILPAFGHLTGLHILKKASGVKVFPVFSDEVIALS